MRGCVIPVVLVNEGEADDPDRVVGQEDGEQGQVEAAEVAVLQRKHDHDRFPDFQLEQTRFVRNVF